MATWSTTSLKKIDVVYGNITSVGKTNTRRSVWYHFGWKENYLMSYYQDKIVGHFTKKDTTSVGGNFNNRDTIMLLNHLSTNHTYMFGGNYLL